MASITVPPQSHSKQPVRIAVGILVTLLLATGAVAWQYRDHTTDHARAKQPAVGYSHPSVSGDTPSVPVSEPSGQAPARVAAPTFSAAVNGRAREASPLYIVASEEAAAWLRASFEAFAQATPPQGILVQGPVADGLSLQDLGALLGGNDAPPPRIVDLREP